MSPIGGFEDTGHYHRDPSDPRLVAISSEISDYVLAKAEGRAEGAAEERARIVAWLRTHKDRGYLVYGHAAALIEGGAAGAETPDGGER